MILVPLKCCIFLVLNCTRVSISPAKIQQKEQFCKFYFTKMPFLLIFLQKVQDFYTKSGEIFSNFACVSNKVFVPCVSKRISILSFSVTSSRYTRTTVPTPKTRWDILSSGFHSDDRIGEWLLAKGEWFGGELGILWILGRLGADGAGSRFCSNAKNRLSMSLRKRE